MMKVTENEKKDKEEEEEERNERSDRHGNGMFRGEELIRFFSLQRQRQVMLQKQIIEKKAAVI